MKKLIICAAALSLSLSHNAFAQEHDSKAFRESVDMRLASQQGELADLYMDLHAHPEVAFQEHRTAGILADRMRSLGFEVTEGVGQTGIVAVLRNGEGPTILVRTDMDGLPMEERTGLPYASETAAMHACGHDMHMVWWVGAAQTLVDMRENWKGTLVFIAQPAEEVLQGARAMLDDGLFTRFPRPDFAFGAHVGNAPAGQVTIKAGAAASASDSYEIIFHGRGGHGSMPSATIDPIVMGARFVSDVQSVVSREKPENEFGVISAGSFQAGTVANIIPDSATVRLTLRSFSTAVRELLSAGLIRTAQASAMMSGAPEPEIIHLSGANVLVNDVDLARSTNAFLAPALGDDLTYIPEHFPGSPPSEDFSEYIAAGVPGVFLQIGGYAPEDIAEYTEKGEEAPANHSPYFAPAPELAIAPGARALALSVLGAMSRDTAPGS